MKNPIRRLIHRYTYDMRLKTKLVISHIILILLPTAVLSGFFFLRKTMHSHAAAGIITASGVAADKNIRPSNPVTADER